MIRVSVTSLVVILASLTAGGVTLLWVWWEWSRHRRERVARKKVRQCGLCFFEFLPSTGEVLTNCPRCGALTVKQ